MNYAAHWRAEVLLELIGYAGFACDSGCPDKPKIVGKQRTPLNPNDTNGLRLTRQIHVVDLSLE